MSMSTSDAPLLTCLVPVRNGARDLPGYLESVCLFCDAIVALDDGSTDDTYDILKSSPSVKLLLRNPRRETYLGWNDYQNRSKLLHAASALSPRWIIWVDADERLPKDEALALRKFLQSSANPAHAYGFRIYPMRNDLEHFEERFIWVYRLFHFKQGQSLEERRLHLFPIPTQIPSSCWIRTTFRYQHLGGMTPERRRERYEKYCLADPNHDFQSDYSPLLREPQSLLPCWQPRAEKLSPLWNWNSNPQGSLHAQDAPALSVLLLETAMSTSVSMQPLRCHMESILGSPGQPSFELLELENVWTDDFLDGNVLNKALEKSSGWIVCLVAQGLFYSPDSYPTLVDEHSRGFAMVTGTGVVHGQSSIRQEQSRQAGAVISGTPQFCSWSRQAILEAGGFPDRLSLDGSELNAKLISLGFQAYCSPFVQFDLGSLEQS